MIYRWLSHIGVKTLFIEPGSPYGILFYRFLKNWYTLNRPALDINDTTDTSDMAILACSENHGLPTFLLIMKGVTYQ